MRREFNGMNPTAIVKFEELIAAISDHNPVVTSRYSGADGEDSFATWGVVCSISCSNEAAKAAACESLGIIIQDDGSLAYTNGLTIDDFKTYRVNSNLELMSEEE